MGIRPRLFNLALLPLLLATLLFQPTPDKLQAADLDFAITGGHFFTQANGQGGAGDLGFAITDEGSIPFWSEYQRLGGVEILGYPISRRFTWDGFVVQAMQKAVIQWRPEQGRVAFVNVFDILHQRGLDDWLQRVHQTPPPVDTTADAGRSWEEIVDQHLSLLDQNPAIKARYFAAANPIESYGLPMSIQDYGSVAVVRAQRAVFQHWKTAVPWARAGQVTVANGGDLAKEAGLLPGEATTPHAAPAARVVPLSAPAAAAAVVPQVGAVEAAVVEATNERRRQNGLAPLAWDEQLALVGRQRSQDLINRGYFSHYDPSTNTLLFDRLLSQQYGGYRGGSGENLYELRSSGSIQPNGDLARSAVEAWMNSPSHRANLLKDIYRKIGIGIALSPDNRRIVITQIFLM